MLLGLFALVVAQSPAQPISVAGLGFSGVNVQDALLTSFGETFALRLAEGGQIKVTTPRDVASVLGIERQRQLLGCAGESPTCLAELAGALGAEAIVTGELARVGNVSQLSIKILSSQGGTLFGTIRRGASEEALLIELDEVAKEARVELFAKLRPGWAAASERPIAPWVLVGGGAALLVVGGVLQGLAARDYGELDDLTRPVSNPAALREAGKVKQGVGLGLIGAGAAAAIAGLVWALVGQPRASAGLWVTSSGGGLVVTGWWP